MEIRKAKLKVDRCELDVAILSAILPMEWTRILGLTEDLNDIVIGFDGDRIIIKADKEVRESDKQRLINKINNLIERQSNPKAEIVSVTLKLSDKEKALWQYIRCFNDLSRYWWEFDNTDYNLLTIIRKKQV